MAKVIDPNKPVKGQKYTLTYYHDFTPRGCRIRSLEFEFMRMHGKYYYFYSENGGIDLKISKAQFAEYRNNTIEKLQNQ